MKRIWPFEHFGLKVLSVGVAVLLWMAVAGEETVERGLRVPLELQQFPAGLELQGEVPTTVDIRVRGTSGTLGRVLTGDIVAVLDLRGARAGRRLFQLNPELVRALRRRSGAGGARHGGDGVRGVVVAAGSGRAGRRREARSGFMVRRTTSDPESVEVVGPESAVKRVTEALTEPVSVAGAHEPRRPNGHRRTSRSGAPPEESSSGDRHRPDCAGAGRAHRCKR